MARLNLEAVIEQVVAQLPETPEDYATFKERVEAEVPGAADALRHLLKAKGFAASFRFEGTKPVLQVAKLPVPPIP